MSRTRLVSTIFIVLIALVVASPAWAGSYVKKADITLSASGAPNVLRSGDLRNASHSDLVVADNSTSPPSIDVYWSNDDGTFTPKQTLALPAGTVIQSFVLGKLDADAFPDLVVSDSGNKKIYTYLNDGTGIFNTSPTANVSTGATAPGKVDVGFFNKAQAVPSNNLDVVTSVGHNIVILAGDGTGALAAPVSVQDPNNQNVTWFAVGDFNGDGNSDVVVLDPSGANKQVDVMIGDGKEAFPSTVNLTASNGTPTRVLAAKITSTSTRDDIVVTGSGTSNNIDLFINATAAPTFTQHTFTVGQTLKDIRVGDADADGKPDLFVVTAANSSNLVILQGNSVDGSAFVNPAFGSPYTAANTPSYGAVGDFFVDGFADVAVANSGSNSVSIFVFSPFSAITPLAVSNPVEGAAFGPTNLLTFKYDGSPASTNFSASVDWGDASPVDVGVVSGPASNIYTVQGPSHSYAEEGPFTATVTVTNTVASPNQAISATNGITVNDALLHAVATPALTNGLGTLPSGTLLANFSDDNASAPITDYTAQVDWGNCGGGGNPGACAFVAVTGAFASLGGGNYSFTTDGTTVSGNYTKQATFTIRTKVTDVGGSTVTVSTTLVVGTVTFTAGSNLTGLTEGTSTGSVAVGTFKSTTTHLATAFSSTIDWDDCGPNNGPGTCAPGSLDTSATITSAPTAGGNCKGAQTCTVTASHTYKYGAQAGTTYNVTVTVKDTTDNSTDGAGLTASVSDAALAAAGSQPGNILGIVEGQVQNPGSVVAVGAFTDSNPLAVNTDFVATVNFQDASGTHTAVVGTVTGSAPNFTINASTNGVVYADEGNFTVKWSVSDNGGGLAGNTLTNQLGATVVVTDAPLVAGAPVTIDNAGSPLVLNVDTYNGPIGTFTDTAAAFSVLTDFNNPTATPTPVNTGGSYVDWGDGNQENCSSVAANTPNCVISGSAGNYSVAGIHKFQTANSALPVVVHIIDIGGAFTTLNDTANVTSIFSVNGAAAPLTSTENNSTPVTTIATFSSLRAGAVKADFNNDQISPNPPNTAKTYVDWGDGKTEPCSSSAANTPNCVISDGPAPPPPTGATANFVIQGAHVYAEGGLDGNTGGQAACVVNGAGQTAHSDCTIVLHIVDNVDSSKNSANSTAQVSDAPLAQAASPALPAAIEGQPLNSGNPVTAGSFTDGDAAATTADFPAGNAFIDWDDCGANHTPGSCGLVAAGTVVANGTNGCAAQFCVQGTHTYLEPGSFNITFSVLDKGGACLGTPTCAPNTPAAGASITVNDGLLAQVAVPAINTTEGVTITNVLIGRFTDENPNPPLTDFTVVVDWGDGGPTSAPASISCSPLGAGSQCDIIGTHAYPNSDEGASVTIKYSVTDVDGNTLPTPLSVTAVGATINFADAPLFPDPNAIALIGTEGGGPVSGVVGIFYDENPNAPAADFTTPPGTISINWGDGSTDTNVVPTDLGAVASDPNGKPARKFSVSGSHNYADGGNDLNGPNCVLGVCQILVSVLDKGGQPVLINTAIATISDAPLVNPVTAPIDNGGNALIANVDTFNGPLGSFTDNAGAAGALTDFDNPTLAATPVNIAGSYVDWGDGNQENCSSVVANTPNCVISGSAGSYSVAGTHLFVKGGQLPVVIHIIDKGGAFVNINDTANVTSIFNVAGAAAVIDDVEGNPLTLGPAQIATFSSSRAAAVAADFNNGQNSPNPPNLTKTYVDWGDGKTDPCSATAANTPNCVITVGAAPPPPAGATANFIITGAHSYSEGGTDIAAGSTACTAAAAPGNPAVCTITVHIVDTQDNSVATPAPTSTAHITDAPLTAAASAPLNGVEGLALNSGNPVIAGSFTDGNPSATVADFPAGSALIDWDDCGANHTAGSCGLVDPGTVVANGTNGCAAQFCVEGIHTYLETNSGVAFNIKFSVVDIGGACLGTPTCVPNTPAAGASATIADGNLTAVASPALNGTEGNGLNGANPVIIGSFTDQNPVAPVTDFTASIDWDDCGANHAPGVCVADSTGVTVVPNGTNGCAAQFCVMAASHNSGPGGAVVYLEPGSFTPHFNVNDVEGKNIANGNGAAVTIVDAVLGRGFTIFGSSANIPVSPAGPFTVAKFFDCNPVAPAGDFGPVTVFWGDGASSANIGTVSPDAPATSANAACPDGTQSNFVVIAPASSHTYAANGNYCIDISVNDVDGQKLVGTNIAPVATAGTCNASGAAGEIDVTPGVINEIPPTTFTYPNVIVGQPVLLFEDSNPGATALDFPGTQIHWGDTSITAGTVAQLPTTTCIVSVNPPPNLCTFFQVTGTHTYASLNSFPVQTFLGGAGASGCLNNGSTGHCDTTIIVNTISQSLVTADVSPPSSQIKAGTSVDLLLTLSPTTPSGYPNPVTVTCSGLGPGMTCTYNPSNTVPDVNQVRQIHILVNTTVNTAMLSAPPLPGRSAPVQLALILPASFGAFGLLLMAPRARKNRRNTILWWIAGLVVLSMLLVGCGGGGNIGGGGGGGGNGTPAGTYQVQVLVNVAGIPNGGPVATIQVVP